MLIPQINHFLFLKFISVNIDSIVPHSMLFFLSHAKSDCVFISVLSLEILLSERRSPINKLNTDFNKTFDKISVKYDNVILIGDLNYNVLDEDKGTPLTTMYCLIKLRDTLGTLQYDTESVL
jgi:hypothetical protein